jgi:hypothetical protein
MKDAVFWDMTILCFCKNRLFRRTYRLHFQGEIICIASIFRVEDEAIHSSDTLVLTRTTQHHVTDDSILSFCRSENLKSYTVILCGMLIITFDDATGFNYISTETDATLELPFQDSLFSVCLMYIIATNQEKSFPLKMRRNDYSYKNHMA